MPPQESSHQPHHSQSAGAAANSMPPISSIRTTDGEDKAAGAAAWLSSPRSVEASGDNKLSLCPHAFDALSVEPDEDFDDDDHAGTIINNNEFDDEYEEFDHDDERSVGSISIAAHSVGGHSVGSISVAAISLGSSGSGGTGGGGSHSTGGLGSLGSGLGSLGSGGGLGGVGGLVEGLTEVDLGEPATPRQHLRRTRPHHRRKKGCKSNKRPGLAGARQQSSLFGVEEEASQDLKDFGGESYGTGLTSAIPSEGLSGGLEAQTYGRSYGIVDDYDADAVLDDGALRFAPRGERPLSAQIQSLTPDERACFDTLRERWDANEGEGRGYDLGDDMILRFARCSPGLEGPFDVESAWRVMKSYDRRYLDLTVADVEEHLRTRTFVVCPGLKTCDGHEVLYMKPGNYPAASEFAARTGGNSAPPTAASGAASQCGSSTYAGSASVSSEPTVDGLVYAVQNLVSDSERNSVEGVAILADMSGWNYTSHFSAPYFHQLVLMLQGRIPVRVRKFLIVNPPGWFRRAWTFIRPVLKEELRDKVVIANGEKEVERYMARDYREHLPDDMEGGKANGMVMVEDFIRYRKHVEGVL